MISSSESTSLTSSVSGSSSGSEEVVVVDDKSCSKVTAWQDLIAGGVAGSASVIVGHPFDTLKVRMQTSAVGNSTKIVWNGLFRGILPPLSTTILVNAIVFSSYGMSSRFYDDYYYSTGSTTTTTTTTTSDWKKSMICGSIAGAVQSVVICPMEHVKCRLQIASAASNSSLLGVVDQIVASHGIRGLYRGMTVTAWREIPAFGLYFSSYDYVKEQLISMSSSPQNNNNSNNNNTNNWASAGAGGFAGCLTWCVVYPLDVLKTRIQTSSLHQKMPIWSTTRQILEQPNGWKSLFRGLNVTLLRAFPVNGIIFPVYEYTLSHLQKR